MLQSCDWRRDVLSTQMSARNAERVDNQNTERVDKKVISASRYAAMPGATWVNVPGL